MGRDGIDELEQWLQDGYDASFRTACLILGNRADAEEAVQEAYLRAWRFRDSLGGGDVRRWLYRVVVNACYSKLRTEIPHRDRRDPSDQAGALAGRHDAIEDADDSGDVLQALRDLEPKLRVVVVLRYYADLSEREIATAIGRPAGTVKSRLHEARRLLSSHPALRREFAQTASSTEGS